jgi:hypothetical protein
VLAAAPQTLFLDPSDTYRLDLKTSDGGAGPGGRARGPGRKPRPGGEINELYLKRDMVPTDPTFIWETRDDDDRHLPGGGGRGNGAVLGSVMGINHVCRLQRSHAWIQPVVPLRRSAGEQARHRRTPGARPGRPPAGSQGCEYMDLSVLHNNEGALLLYKKLGFRQVHTFAIKNKNAFNENLFIGPELEEDLNPYARIIVDEARARGISVEVLDAEEPATFASAAAARASTAANR